MFRPITTLDLSSLMITELHKKGYFYVEDLESDLDNLEKIGLDKSNIEKQLKLDEKLALDVWQNETQQGSLSLCCSELETILQNGFQCRNITELSGASFTGKTQICMQLCISVQLNKHYGGLNGRAIYIDTRCGPVLMRFRDLLEGYNNFYKDLKLQEDDIFDNIKLWEPCSVEELLKMIDCLKEESREIRNNKTVKLVIVDSLSWLILCCIDDARQRPHYFSRILSKLHKLALSENLCVIVTNELVTQVDKDSETYLVSAGGQYVADYIPVRLEMTRLTEDKFASRLVKSPMMPEMSVTFMITKDGVRNVTQSKK